MDPREGEAVGAAGAVARRAQEASYPTQCSCGLADPPTVVCDSRTHRRHLGEMGDLISGTYDVGPPAAAGEAELDYLFWNSTRSHPASAVGRLPSPRSGVNGQARRLAGTVAAQGS